MTHFSPKTRWVAASVYRCDSGDLLGTLRLKWGEDSAPLAFVFTDLTPGSALALNPLFPALSVKAPPGFLCDSLQNFQGHPEEALAWVLDNHASAQKAFALLPLEPWMSPKGHLHDEICHLLTHRVPLPARLLVGILSHLPEDLARVAAVQVAVAEARAKRQCDEALSGVMASKKAL